jgi:hypothetical protein
MENENSEYIATSVENFVEWLDYDGDELSGDDFNF